MEEQRSYTIVRKTRRGRILRVLREHYLRSDLSLGYEEVFRPKEAQAILIPDVNVVLHQIDVLENPVFQHVVLLQTVVEEIKRQNRSLYSRVMAMLSSEKSIFLFANEHHNDTYVVRDKHESFQDRNDRAVRSAALFYQRELNESIPVFLLTNDEKSLELAKKYNILAKKVHDYVKDISTDHPDLVDQLNYTNETVDDEAPEQGEIAKQKTIFPEHWPLSQIKEKLSQKSVFQGVLRVKRGNINEGKVEISGSSGYKEIKIMSYIDMNRAVDNDVVAVKILPTSQWVKSSAKIQENPSKDRNDQKNQTTQPCGTIVGIIKRNWRLYCGAIEEGTEVGHGSRAVFFIPVNKNVPKIRIRTRQTAELMTKRITVAIDTWDKNSFFPSGHYVSTLGDIGDLDVESEVVLMEHNIPHYEFPQEVMKCLPPSDYQMTQDDIKVRTDLRGELVMSIDPPGCKDIDDALHAKYLDNGNIEIGVHIADVTHFVKEGTALDDEAAKRSTSVYLVDRRIDMLPKVLTEHLCSLVSNVPRFSFSCIWEMTPDAQIVNTRFCKSIIKSRSSMTYGEAQTIIDDPNRSDDIAQSLRLLGKVAQYLRKRRFENGALVLSSPQPKFDLDTETMNPLDISMYESKQTNSLVEEFMLLANISVGKKILESYPKTAVLRRHPHPDSNNFDKLVASLKLRKLDLDVQSSKTLSASLDKVHMEDNKYVNSIVRMLTTRCMQQAKYFPAGDFGADEYSHYGLAVPLYTHFTSPIRRYADVLVHRLLGCAIGAHGYSLTPKITDINLLREQTKNMNNRTQSEKEAERSSVELYTLFYFKNRAVVEDAVITNVRANAINCFVPRYGFDHVVFLDEISSASNRKWTYKEETQTLSNGDYSLQIFDRVKVKIFVKTTKNYRSRLIMELQQRKRKRSPEQPTKSLEQPPRKKRG